ncbi:GroES-like protein [Thozetella sp. PMI_491]|nr:GroES-like protein [Thozetella sp. PMI_491]
MKGDWPMPPDHLPLVGGHEGAGVVVAKGELVSDDEFMLGDYAGVKWINGVCTKCDLCKQAHEELCTKARLSGYTVDGSFQQYAIVKAVATNKIPKGVDLAAAAPIMCAGVTVYRGLKYCGARPGQYVGRFCLFLSCLLCPLIFLGSANAEVHVAIIGAGGGLGTLGVQYAKAMGFIPIAVDIGEEKGRVCKELGAETYIDFATSKSVVEGLKKATHDGQGAHAAIIVSSEEEPFAHASEFVRALGTVMIVGIPADGYIKAQIWDTSKYFPPSVFPSVASWEQLCVRNVD